ncbi:MAG: diadenylate cyclase CdaA [Clostridia bacterium]|nr:diadenylate cyclase CdaA [Clostridia bacterium]
MGQFFNVIVQQLSSFWTLLRSIRIIDIIDIAIVSVVIYYAYKFIKTRRAAKLAIGVALLLVVFIISDIANMYALGFILSNVFQIGLIALVILFQPELRAILEKMGTQPLKGFKNISEGKNTAETSAMISNVCEAVTDMSASKTGCLIVIERTTKLGDIEKTGTVLTADVNASLIKNIFFNKAPLHDGAMIISNNKIVAAGCFLPLSQKNDIFKDLGTRHRAAIGMSENSDAIVIVVSEETGTVSIALDGQLKRNFDYTALKNQLYSLLVNNQKNGKQHKKQTEVQTNENK